MGSTLTAIAKLEACWQPHMKNAAIMPRKPERHPSGSQNREERKETVLHAIQKATSGCISCQFVTASGRSAIQQCSKASWLAVSCPMPGLALQLDIERAKVASSILSFKRPSFF